MVQKDVQILLPASLTSRQRALLHEVAEECGLAHSSTGEGSQRRLILGDAEVTRDCVSDGDGPIADDALAALLEQHLGAAVRTAFQGSAAQATTAGPGTHGIQARPGKGGNKAQVSGPSSGERSANCGDVPGFAARMQSLLDLEQAAEVSAAEAALDGGGGRGLVLPNLRLTGVEAGLLGRSLLTLVHNKGTPPGPLPVHKFGPHDIVRLRASKAAAGAPVLAEGVVYRLRDDSIVIAVDDTPEDGLDVPLRLEKLVNTVTHTRMKAALNTLASASEHGSSPLIDVCFGRRPAAPATPLGPVQWTNASLDETQREAVCAALSCPDLALIHGPPGTGKTTAVVEAIVQVLDVSLEAKVLRSDNSALAKDCRKEMKALNAQLLKLQGRREGAARRGVRSELRLLAKEERKRQERAVAEVLAATRVVCCTLAGVDARQLRDLPDFDLVVVDEAAQALEPACWSALLRGKRGLLAGDHLQLPPTVGMAPKGPRSVMLTQQYRMHTDIMDWCSVALYGGRLVAAPAVAAHTLADLPGVHGDDSALCAALLFIDTAGCDCPEAVEREGGSTYNPREAAAAMAHVARLLAAGVRPEDVGVITPYAAQVARLRELRPPELAARLEISTVDGFQGREKEAVVISCVRSSGGEAGGAGVGFLADARRMNVAVTRARRHCALVGDGDTLAGDAFLAGLVDHASARGEYESAADLLEG
ncbi:DNA-binding protein SMUBP-2 [Auxenochlorella protothecoides]|uniref:DNA helicase n=1 Tax=Auxenochlorella protothecoides TaxID=3075 RepID=A0A087SAQ3_AUXPR|nr:DNA-binding protein SMUBP-2 [Auxenochlorella protothecoides]KFM22807.1 DNA-binding protein SMUBP-2 [Auxenochlorella protothecoides]